MGSPNGLANVDRSGPGRARRCRGTRSSGQELQKEDHGHHDQHDADDRHTSSGPRPPPSHSISFAGRAVPWSAEPPRCLPAPGCEKPGRFPAASPRVQYTPQPRNR